MAGAAVAGASIVVWSSTLPDSRENYILVHAVGAAPLLVATLVCTWRVLGSVGPEFRGFWWRWFAACTLSTAAASAALGAVALDSPVLLAVDVAMLVVSWQVWGSASVEMVRAQVGRRSVSIDVLDAGMALIVLGAPVLLLIAEPVGRSDEQVFAVAFVGAAVAAPAVLYLSLVSVVQAPPGRRTQMGLGVVLGASFTLGISLQLNRVVGDIDVPLPLILAVYQTSLALIVAIPLWAHRRPAARLEGVPAEQQVRRRHPMPYVSALVLPLVAVWVALIHEQHPWGVVLLVVVLLAVVALNAVRYTAMWRETQRLYQGLVDVAEERRLLLARMLRALEDDRHRTATELHSQAVRSLTALGTTIQTAHAALPPDTALVIRQAMAQTQADLAERAEELRRLMLAMRSPAFEPDTRDAACPEEGGAGRTGGAGQAGGTGGAGRPGGSGRGGDSTLAAALSAYAAELPRGQQAPALEVTVAPDLELDWSTRTIVYRIAQEALLNVAQHAHALRATVRVGERDGGVLLEVSDDGVGFDPATTPRGRGLATMELFAQLGRGELTVRSTPGGGTTVQGLLGVRDVVPMGRHPRPHLRVVRGTGPEEGTEPEAGAAAGAAADVEAGLEVEPAGVDADEAGTGDIDAHRTRGPRWPRPVR
jgi:signal transduction histidine kinase